MFDILSAVFGLLPLSPFLQFYNNEVLEQYLGYINFFIPFDLMYNIVFSWTGALTVYYLFKFLSGSLSFKNGHLANLFATLF